jgi:Tfp pilus assembly protein PilE
MKQPSQDRECTAERWAGFTLVELLAVIGIMAAMLAIAVPAFTSLTQGSGLRAAAVQLRSDLSLARQYAINKSFYVYVVFPTVETRPARRSGDKTPVSEAVGVPYCTYAAFFMENEQGGDHGTVNFLTEWKRLPEGVFFDSRLKKKTNLLTYDKINYVQYPIDMWINGAFSIWDHGKPQPTLVFSPRGSVVYVDIHPRFVHDFGALLREDGAYLYLTQGVSIKPSEPPNYTAGEGFYLQLNPLTGRSRMDTYAGVK